jgi:hypothetical protein
MTASQVMPPASRSSAIGDRATRPRAASPCHTAPAASGVVVSSFQPVDLAFPVEVATQEGQPRSELSALDWTAVAIARFDGLSSLAEPGPISVVLGALFGRRVTTRLANSRLEALRRIAVLCWHRESAASGRDIKAFTDAGFTLDQYETVHTRIRHMKSESSRRR